MEEENILKPIEEQKKETNEEEQIEVINKLPDWSIEPPIEIKRGEE